MSQIIITPSSSISISAELWKENKYGGWFAISVISLLFLWQLFKFISPVFQRLSVPPPSSAAAADDSRSSSPISDFVSEGDLKSLIDDLDEKANDSEKWENVIKKSRSSVSYMAKCCKPKDGPLKYLSRTVFEDCSPEILRDFYMDCNYRKQWDKTVVTHDQLQIDKRSGVEIGRTIKKFPLLTPREYIMAWKLWEGSNKTFYCYTRDCQHLFAPRQKKFVRVAFFRSGWRISPVAGRNACEIKMVHQEDAGLNVEMAKLAFAKGIWNYVCKMDDALRKYGSFHYRQSSLAMTAVSFIQKVPPELDALSSAGSSDLATTSSKSINGRLDRETKSKNSRKPTKKMIANGLLLVGSIMCLSHGSSGLGAKVAVAFILKKLCNRAPSSNQNHRG